MNAESRYALEALGYFADIACWTRLIEALYLVSYGVPDAVQFIRVLESCGEVDSW